VLTSTVALDDVYIDLSVSAVIATPRAERATLDAFGLIAPTRAERAARDGRLSNNASSCRRMRPTARTSRSLEKPFYAGCAARLRHVLGTTWRGYAALPDDNPVLVAYRHFLEQTAPSATAVASLPGLKRWITSSIRSSSRCFDGEVDTRDAAREIAPTPALQSVEVTTSDVAGARLADRARRVPCCLDLSTAHVPLFWTCPYRRRPPRCASEAAAEAQLETHARARVSHSPAA